MEDTSESSTSPRLPIPDTSFPFDLFADNSVGISLSSIFRPRQMYAPNKITKVTSGGTTVCAVSSMGDVFSFSLTQSQSHLKHLELPKTIEATRIWSLRRRHMAVRDVAVGQDGTVIISTESGSVWTRIRRAKPKISHEQGGSAKEYKFARVGSLNRVVAVRANGAGAYAAIRNDVELRDIAIEGSSLESDLIMGIPLGKVVEELRQKETNVDLFDSDEVVPTTGKEDVSEYDRPWTDLFVDLSPPSEACDVAFVLREGHRIYLHKAMLACRSSAFRNFLKNPTSTDFEVETINGVMDVHFDDIGIVAASQLVHYIYTDKLMGLPECKDNHKPERLEMIHQLRHLAAQFRLKHLSDMLTSSWYIVLTAEKSLRKHLRSLQSLSSALTTPDAILCLADCEIPCHSFILAASMSFLRGNA